MKKRFPFTTLCLSVLTIAAIVFLVGCVTPAKDSSGVVITNAATGMPVYVPDTNSLNKYVELAKGLNSLSAPVNPYATVINPVIGWIGTAILGISTFVAGYKNNQKAKVIAAVVQGVEGAATDNTQSVTLADVKKSIQASASAAGVQPDLHAIVQANT